MPQKVLHGADKSRQAIKETERHEEQHEQARL
jgi:hypothetical protein